MTEESDPFIDWVKESIDYGVECLDVSDGEVLVFLGMESGQRQAIKVEYLGDESAVEGRLSAGRELIAQSDDAQYYALIWSGQGPDGTGQRYVDVIAVEMGSRSGESVFLTQPYQVAHDHTLVASGGPLVSEAEIPNMWTAGESHSGDDSDDATADGEESESDQETEPGPLDDLVEHVFYMAVERRKAGNEMPCACLSNSGDEDFSILDPTSGDASADEIVEYLRQHVATLEDWEMYAIVYFSTMEMNGKDVDTIIVEAGDRDGQAPIFGLPFKISKSGKIKIEEIEYLDEAESLWVETEE